MSVENEIQELERSLELKKAYLNVHISWGKGYKAVPEDIREEVQTKLRECAMLLAAGNPINTNKDFTEQEIVILKTLAGGIASGAKKKDTPKTTSSSPAKLEQPEYAKDNTNVSLIGKKAELLLLDNVSSDQRKLVQSGSVVTIISQRGHRFYVEDPIGNRFWIPTDDIQLVS